MQPKINSRRENDAPGEFYSASTFGLLYGSGGNAGGVQAFVLRRPEWHWCRFHFLREFKPSVAVAPVNRDHVSQTYLVGREQLRERVHHVSLDGALEMTRAVFQVRPFPQQKFSRSRSHAKHKVSFRRLQHALLDHP